MVRVPSYFRAVFSFLLAGALANPASAISPALQFCHANGAEEDDLRFTFVSNSPKDTQALQAFSSKSFLVEEEKVLEDFFSSF